MNRPTKLAPLLGWLALAVALLVLAPALLSDFRLGLLAKYCCYAIAAVGIGLAWGRGGMLVLGQGLYFGLGGYAMAMHLKLTDAGPGNVPDFMTLYAGGEMPLWWEPFRSPAVTVLAIVLLPVVVATVLGAAIFKRRVKGAYFAILSQALTAAFAILLVGQVKTTGGFNGLNNFQSFFGYSLYDPVNKQMLYFIAAGVLLASIALMSQLYRSRFGELLVATRDAEERVRFLGHDPANIKLVAYVVAAVLASVGGALFVPIVGIISPEEVGVGASIAMVAGVALGGRASLMGPALGALMVGYAETSLSESFPGSWSYFQGGLFIVVVLLLPGGLAQLFSRLGGLRRRSAAPPPSRHAEDRGSRDATPDGTTQEVNV
ncbi:urea ABC transporter permease subunit UrtC [Nocardioides campestrisoli]|uniref:urea ABC transporter permease subunit UrtC n=1 Tax=Nocardioides campestrisoli TaxID=2736757 RepID=UPI0015E6FCA2|nr:urea ABC transporter permease subunit UrtC [Nocardioides campestrisoli]